MSRGKKIFSWFQGYKASSSRSKKHASLKISKKSRISKFNFVYNFVAVRTGDNRQGYNENIDNNCKILYIALLYMSEI